MLLKIKLYSEILKKESNISVIIPKNRKAKVLKVLWLLHGGDGDDTEWGVKSNIEGLTKDKDICVIMPDMGSSFYSDMVSDGMYFTYLTEELPSILTDLLPISKHCDDNFVAGNSMGGYGAYKMALNYPEKYSMAAAFSGSFDLKAIYDYAMENDEATAIHFNKVYGSIEDFIGSKSDLFSLIKKREEESIPKLYACLGSNDFLYDVGISFVDYLKSLNIQFIYEEDKGYGHDFDYWNYKLVRVLEWMGI